MSQIQEHLKLFVINFLRSIAIENFPNDIKHFVIVNGAGGDGGVESYAEFNDDTFIVLYLKRYIILQKIYL